MPSLEGRKTPLSHGYRRASSPWRGAKGGTIDFITGVVPYKLQFIEQF